MDVFLRDRELVICGNGQPLETIPFYKLNISPLLFLPFKQECEPPFLASYCEYSADTIRV